MFDFPSKQIFLNALANKDVYKQSKPNTDSLHIFRQKYLKLVTYNLV